MNRWAWVFICAVLGLAAVLAGLLMPVHLRAVDARLLALAGQNTRKASVEQFPVADDTNAVAAPAQDFTDLIILSGNREQTLARLAASQNPAVQELLRCRTLTNTAVFSASQSAAGQAFDAALCIEGALLDEGKLTARLNSSINAQATDANRSGNSEALELTMLDFMSLGQRMTYAQLATFVGHIETPETLRVLTDEVRKEVDVPTLYAAVDLSEKPDAVAQYLGTFSESGMKDLQTASGYGAGGVRELVERKQRLDVSNLPYAVGLNFCLRNPQFALTVKWLLYLAGGFLLAMALHFAGRPARELEKPLQVRGFHVAREALFAMGFLLVVLIVSEPFLVQEGQKGITPFRLHLPGLGSAGPAGTPVSIGGFMNQVTLLTMLLFFVLQALLYTASLVKLAEIRRQGVPARMKLKLLENEDHLFDAGLYLGFLGTIISLVLVSLGVFKQPSLMAAYSSTSFGILFVVLFKVLHLRPARRTLLMESEYSPAPAEPVAPTHTFAAPL